VALTKIETSNISATGTADGTTFLRGDMAWASAAAGFNSVQILTSSQTWNKPAGVTKVVVEVQGAGGGSSQGNGVQWGGNGGAGAYVKQFFDVSSITASAVVVGAGGAGGTSPGTGGTSSWDDTASGGSNTISCTGGVGAEYASSGHNDGGAGGTATLSSATNSYTINGQAGQTTYGQQSMGGNSPLGFGGTQKAYDSATPVAPVGYGSGGSSGLTPSGTGNAGTAGIVIVWEFK
jgi:hypothetical protein